MTKIIRIGIADDHTLLREGLKALLLEYEGITVVFDVGNGADLLYEIKKKQPEIILLDIEMPGLNGKEALDIIKIKYPTLKVIVLTNYYNDSNLVYYLKNGAASFLPKNFDIEKIVDAIYSLHERGYYYDKHTFEILKNKLNNLTEKSVFLSAENLFSERELSVLRFVCVGKTNVEIAELLNLSVRTVEGHRYNISKKTNTHNVIALLDYARKNGIFI